MRDYRAYYFDDSGRIVRREVVRGTDDAQALMLLAPPGREAAVELWDLGRLVKRIERLP